jgi:hypothetical protein
MKTSEGWKWAVLVVMAVFFAYLGKVNYHHRHVGLFPLIVLAAVAAMLFVFWFFRRRES